MKKSQPFLTQNDWLSIDYNKLLISTLLPCLNEGSSGHAKPPLFLGKFIRAGDSERKTSPVFRGGGPEDRRGVLGYLLKYRFLSE